MLIYLCIYTQKRINSMSLKKTVYLLTYAGSIPFIILTLTLYLAKNIHAPITLMILINYTGIITSFMAGSQWGLAIKLEKNPGLFLLFFSTATSVLAWISLAILCFTSDQTTNIFIISICLLTFLLMTQLIVDTCIAYKNSVIEKWYHTLSPENHHCCIILFTYQLI